MEERCNLSLWYDTVLVGEVSNAFYSDLTWYGVFSRVVDPANSEIDDRIVNYIEFCEDWNERTHVDTNNPPDPAEFDRYNDIITSGLWFTKDSTGSVTQIADAPVFFKGGEISWRVEEPREDDQRYSN